MQERHVLTIRFQGEDLDLPLRSTDTRGSVETRRSSVEFDIPADTHTYLSSKETNSYAVPPTRSALPLSPAEWYRLSGTVGFQGLGRAQLYVIEYSAASRLATHSTRLENGKFELRWFTHPESVSCCVAIRLSGWGQLTFQACGLEPCGSPCDLAKALPRMDGETTKTRIFIAGCPRSGTTLMLNMMRCFRDTYVDLVERPAQHYALIDCAERNIVLKRTGDCWGSLHLIPPCIDVLYMVRNPLDVLTSKHPLDKRRYFVDFDYWKSEFAAYKKLADARRSHDKCVVVQYEDLVANPMRVQARLQEKWNLELADRDIGFDRFHVLSSGEKTSRFQAAMGGVRPPDTRSVGRWHEDCGVWAYLQDVIRQHRAEITESFDVFGYARDGLFFDAAATGFDAAATGHAEGTSR